jgi:mono/diheme cytochrome c family protein
MSAWIFVLGASLASMAQTTEGKVLWVQQRCALCHGDAGKGDSPMGKRLGIGDMSGEKWQRDYGDDAIRAAISKGVDKEQGGKKVKMMAFDKLTAADVDALLRLIRGFAATAPPAK